jgi:tetratricopeptide (TPR) repeat protein
MYCFFIRPFSTIWPILSKHSGYLSYGVITKKYKKNPKKKMDEKVADWMNDHPHRVREYSQKEFFSYYNYAMDSYKECQNPIDKHVWLDILVGWCYRNREYPELIQKAISYGLEDIELFKDCMEQCDKGDFGNLTSEMGKLFNTQTGSDPKTFLMRSFADVAKKIMTIYEKTDRYKDAIEICEKAISLGIRDEATKGGLEKRLTMLNKHLSTS